MSKDSKFKSSYPYNAVALDPKPVAHYLGFFGGDEERRVMHLVSRIAACSG